MGSTMRHTWLHTIHYGSVGNSQQLTQDLDSVEVRPAIELLVASMFCTCIHVLVIQMSTASCRKRKSCQRQSCNGGYKPGDLVASEPQYMGTDLRVSRGKYIGPYAKFPQCCMLHVTAKK